MPMLGGTRVLVTGGAGFIGSALVRQLAGAGASVVVVDNLVNGKRENLAEVEGPRVRVVVDDIRNVELMRSLVQGVDCVFHLACLGVRHSLHAPRESHDVNAAATLDLLGIARAAGVGRLVCVSTSEVYGTARWAPMTEEHPTFPMTVYGAAKLAGECYARAYWETYRFPTVVVRPFNAYGPRCHHEGDAGEVIPKFVLRAMAGLPLIIFGDGSQTRDFTYVEDTAAGILKVGFANDAVGRTINIGSGAEISVSDLAAIVLRTVGNANGGVVHDGPRPGDVLRLCADVSLARKLFSYAPRIAFEDGLSRLLQWYKSRRLSVQELLAEETVHNWVEKRQAGDA